MFGGVKKLIWWNKLGLQLSKAQDSIQQYKEDNPMTWKENLLNVGKHLLIAGGSVVGSALITWVAGPDFIGVIDKSLQPAVGTTLYPPIHAAIVLAINYLTKMKSN